MGYINKNELIEKLKEFELINRSIKNEIEPDDGMVYFIGIPHVIDLINECEEHNITE